MLEEKIYQLCMRDLLLHTVTYMQIRTHLQSGKVNKYVTYIIKCLTSVLLYADFIMFTVHIKLLKETIVMY